MADRWQLIGMNHINAIVDGYAATVEHFRDRLGMDLSFEIPDSGDGTDAVLFTYGGAMFEFFAPKERTERGQGRLLDKFGDHYIGIEFQVPNLDDARTAAATNEIRIINDMGSAFFTYPGSSFGVAWEIYDGNFRQHHKSAEYWRDEHPMGLLGLDHMTLAVNDLDASVARLTQITDATVIGQVDRPEAAAAGLRAQVGGLEFELLQPTGDGPVATYLARYGERIRSTVWKVADLDRMTSFLTAQGFDLVPGDAAGALAIPPEQNKNLLFEFTE